MASERARDGKGREYQQGDHVCLVYNTPAEQLALAVDYIADGLRRNERCLYSVPTQAGLDDRHRANPYFDESIAANRSDTATFRAKMTALRSESL